MAHPAVGDPKDGEGNEPGLAGVIEDDGDEQAGGDGRAGVGEAFCQGESQQRGSEERATGLSRQAGAEKEVDDAAKQQPWFLRRFRPAQLGESGLEVLRQCRL